MRAGVVAQRKLEHVLEEHRSHHLVLAVCEPIGVERDERAANDGEQGEADPGSEQQHQVPQLEVRDTGLGIGQGVDDPPEQERFHEHGGGERQIGQRQYPAQTGLPPEQFQHAEVETEEFHVADIGTVVALRSGLPMHSNPMSQRPQRRHMASGTRPSFARTQRLCKCLKAQKREQHNICRFLRFRQRLLLRLTRVELSTHCT